MNRAFDALLRGLAVIAAGLFAAIAVVIAINVALRNLGLPVLYGALDAIQEKIISRKLLVFGVATALLWYVGLDADTWGMIAMTYIGGQTAIDFAKVWKGA